LSDERKPLRLVVRATWGTSLPTEPPAEGQTQEIKRATGRPALRKIYGTRWGIESLYAEKKAFMEVENFRCSFVDRCEQEIAAAMIWMARASYLQAEAETGLADGRSVVRATSNLQRDLIQGRNIDQCMAEDIGFLRGLNQKTKPERHYPTLSKSV
jgi:hypothetical protein